MKMTEPIHAPQRMNPFYFDLSSDLIHKGPNWLSVIALQNDPNECFYFLIWYPYSKATCPASCHN